MTLSIEALTGIVASKGGLARSSLFQVDLPGDGVTASNELNLLCREASLPGRQIMTMEYPIGAKTEKIAYGAVTDDVSMSFLVLNDYKVRKYFEDWQAKAFNPELFQVGYKSDYAKQIAIHQLDKGVSFPVLNRDFGTFSLPSNLTNRFPSGLIDFAQGQLDIDFFLPSRKIFTCTLDKAWPVTIEATPLTNDADGIVELRVQFSYVKWTSQYY